MRTLRHILFFACLAALCSCQMSPKERDTPHHEDGTTKVVPRPTDWTDRVAATNYWLYLLDKHADLAYKIPDTAAIVNLIVNSSIRNDPRFGEERELLDLAYAMHAVLLKGELQIDENPPEPWIRPLGEEEGRDTILAGGRRSEIKWAWRAEYELHLLDKYDGWTEEMIARYRQQLADEGKSFDEQWEAGQEFNNLRDARVHAQIRATPPPDRSPYTDPHLLFLQTDEAILLRELAQRPLTDAEREALNQIIERLNQGAKTNLLLRYYWPLTADGLQGYSL